jgi:hypothetical protein
MSEPKEVFFFFFLLNEQRTSLILFLSVSIIVKRSIPKPHPPCNRRRRYTHLRKRLKKTLLRRQHISESLIISKANKINHVALVPLVLLIQFKQQIQITIPQIKLMNSQLAPAHIPKQ